MQSKIVSWLKSLIKVLAVKHCLKWILYLPKIEDRRRGVCPANPWGRMFIWLGIVASQPDQLLLFGPSIFFLLSFLLLNAFHLKMFSPAEGRDLNLVLVQRCENWFFCMSSFFHRGILILSSRFIYLWDTVLAKQFSMPEKNYLVKDPHKFNDNKSLHWMNFKA